MVRLPPRLLGSVLLACSCGSTFAHRAVYEAVRHGPAQASEFGLALLTFVLASTGVLLLIHGGRLFRPAGSAASTADRPALSHLQAVRAMPITIGERAFDTRHGASMMQARHAIATSRRLRSGLVVETMTRGRAGHGRTVHPRR